MTKKQIAEKLIEIDNILDNITPYGSPGFLAEVSVEARNKLRAIINKITS